MNSRPKRRQSIHPDVEGNLNTTLDLLSCDDCKSSFLVSKDGTETKLESDEAIKKYQELEQKKTGEGDTNFSTPTKFKCKGCKPLGVARQKGPEESTAGIPISWKILFTTIFIMLACIILPTFQFIHSNISFDIQFHYKRIKNIPVNYYKESYESEQLEKQLLKLEAIYKNQIEDTWISLSSGIKSVVTENPNKPSVFLMIFDSDSGGNTAQCIAKAVSKHAISFLMKKSDTPEMVYGGELDSKSLLDDPGLFLKQLKSPVQEKGALVLVNLHEMPPKVAKMLHYVCDKYSPLVERAVTFFTLKVDVMPSQENLVKKVEQRMKDLWSSAMDEHELRPLITRMTSNIIRIYPDSACYGF